MEWPPEPFTTDTEAALPPDCAQFCKAVQLKLFLPCRPVDMGE